MSPILYSVIGGASMLIITSVYRLMESGIRKRVTVRSPEMAAVLKLVPAVNMMLPILGSILSVQKTTLEAVKGKCNGNVDKAFCTIEEEQERYDDYIMGRSRIEGME